MPINVHADEFNELMGDEFIPLINKGDQQNLQYVTSFELMALWVSTGYGVGLSAQSRIKRAHGWGISMRPLDDGPYEIVTHLHRPQEHANSVAERFERRALQIAKTATS